MFNRIKNLINRNSADIQKDESLILIQNQIIENLRQRNYPYKQIEDLLNSNNIRLRGLLELKSRLEVAWDEELPDLLTTSKLNGILGLDGGQGVEAVERIKPLLIEIGNRVIDSTNDYFKQNGINSTAKGIMYFGSRVNPRKTPKENSDLDYGLFLDEVESISPRQLTRVKQFVRNSVLSELQKHSEFTKWQIDEGIMSIHPITNPPVQIAQTKLYDGEIVIVGDSPTINYLYNSYVYTPEEIF